MTRPAMILCGGQALRMGGVDKPLLPLGTGTILDAVIARLAPQAGPLALNANGDPARFARFGLPVLADPVPGWPGPLAGVLAAMDWAAGLGALQVLTVPGDTPFLPADLVARLAPGPAFAESASGPHPVCAIWPVAGRDDIARRIASGQARVRDAARALHLHAVRFDGDPDPFANVNTPADLELARRRFTGMGAA